MTAVYTQQTRLPPSTSSVTMQGSGLHSALAHDMVRNLNNLGYTDPGVCFAYNPNLALNYYYTAAAVDHLQVFVGQVPVWLSRGAGDFKWALGYRVSMLAGQYTMTVNSVKVYLAQEPYRSSLGDFGTSGAPPAYDYFSVGGFEVCSTAVNVGPTGDTGYRFATGSLGHAPQVWSTMGDATYVWAHVVIEVTSARLAQLTLRLHDFTTWCTPE